MNGSLFKKGLVSLAAASVIAGSAYAAGDGVINTTVDSFRVVTDKTTVEKGNAINIVVGLLDENGKIDPFAESNVDYVYVSANSILGKISAENNASGNDDNSFDKMTGTSAAVKVATEAGKAGFSVSYDTSAKTGTDTLRFYAVIVDTDGDTKTLGPIEKTVTVTTPSNKAKGLEIISVQSDNGGTGNYDKTDYTTDPVATNDSEADFVAAQPITFKVVALSATDTNGTYDANSTSTGVFETSQNSTVTLDFISTTTADSWGNKTGSSSGTIVTSVTGEMTNGVAFISVPEGTLTKAGLYHVRASTSTTATSSKVAYSDCNYELLVSPESPTSIGAKVATGSYSAGVSNNGYMFSPVSGSKDDNNVTLFLADTYGNYADASTLLTSYYAYVYATEATSPKSTNKTKVTFNSSTSSKGVTITPANYSDLTLADGVATSTVTVESSDLTVLNDSLDITIYTRDLNTTYGTSGTSFTASMTAGVLYEKVISLFDTNTTLGTPNGYSAKVDLINSSGTIVDSSTALIVDNNLSVRFTKATSGNISRMAITVLDGPWKPDYNTSFTLIEVNASAASTLALYKGPSSSSSCVSGTSSATEVTEITVDKKDTYTLGGYGDGFIIDTNASKKSSAFANNTYVVTLEDVYGNAVSNTSGQVGTLVVKSSSDGLTPKFDGTLATSTGKSLAISSYDDVNVTYGTTGTDTITIASSIPGVAALSIPVTVTDTTPSISSIELIKGSDYMLTNGEMAIVVKAYDQYGSAIDMGTDKLSIVLSNPNLVTVYDANRSNGMVEYESGNFLNSTKSEYSNGIMTLDLQASNTEGALAVTVRNTSGSATATANVEIVSSTAKIINATDSVAISPTSTNVEAGATATLTIKVMDDSGAPLANKSAQIASDNTGIATVSISSGTTDSSGEIAVTVTGVAEGIATITATAEGKSGTATVNVGTATSSSSDSSSSEESSSSSSVDEIAVAIDTLTGTNGGTWTISGYFYQVGSGAWDWKYCMSGTCYQLTGFDADTGYFTYEKDTEGNYVTSSTPDGDYSGSFVNYGSGAYDWAYVPKGYEDQNFKLGGNSTGINWGALTGLNAAVDGDSVTFTK